MTVLELICIAIQQLTTLFLLERKIKQQVYFVFFFILLSCNTITMKLPLKSSTHRYILIPLSFMFSFGFLYSYVKLSALIMFEQTNSPSPI